MTLTWCCCRPAITPPPRDPLPVVPSISQRSVPRVKTPIQPRLKTPPQPPRVQLSNKLLDSDSKKCHLQVLFDPRVVAASMIWYVCCHFTFVSHRLSFSVFTLIRSPHRTARHMFFQHSNSSFYSVVFVAGICQRF